MVETNRVTVREAVAVLEDVGKLETVVEELRAAGFAEDEISLLARLEPWRVRLFCTDDWAPYNAALPAGRHYIGKEETHGCESNNARQRHWFARFRRRTCVVSRSVEMVEVTMALFAFYHCNGGQLTPALVA